MPQLIAVRCQFEEAAGAIGRCLHSSQVGRALFVNVWLTCSRKLFLEEVKKRVVMLDKEAWSEDHYERAQAGIADMAGTLKADGHKKGRNSWTGKDFPLGSDLVVHSCKTHL